ncbi:MAG: 16S rRNA (cytidine(1402)-2'-O)-methyltransferase [Burkholderiaceae bacterium]|nr:16S rRNA (cytidine(1402)-2'-O)-methyltransferase [Burkholderiaceae bacterium]
MVATPIGNLADLTLRAVHVLALVDAVACEDSRVTGALLHHLGLHKPLIALHQHNERERATVVVQQLRAGQRVAYASDAGTPAMSDPGAALVQAVAGEGFRVVPIPGASSVAAAISVAGDAAAGFRFCGFAPHGGQVRQHALDMACDDPGTQVWLESPHRIVSLAESWAARAGSRRVTVCRELTKQFETVATLPVRELPAWLAADGHRTRGEFVLVLHAATQVAGDNGDGVGVDAAAQRVLTVLLDELPLKQAVSLAARISGAPRNALYRQALQRRAADDER